MTLTRVLLFVSAILASFSQANGQEKPLQMNTIDRPPFAYLTDGEPDGYSVELMQMIGAELGRDVAFRFTSDFTELLQTVETGEVHGAIANISITAAREQVMDFSQPIFESGLRIMVKGGSAQPSILSLLLSIELLLAVIAAFAVLFLLGLLMWVFERGKQEYFNRPASQALFPSFWWALNLVVNGGFEERAPRSAMGRLLGVIMVVASLFIVSIFVAHITAQMTVEAITGNINQIEDLDGRRVATTRGSTASAYLENRGVGHRTFTSYAELIESFEQGDLDAVVFDGPLLSHYIRTEAVGEARLIDRVFRPEDYGIALPQGSLLREPINRALLNLNESGAIRDLRTKWFGRRD